MAVSGYGPFMGEGDTARRAFTVLKPYRAPRTSSRVPVFATDPELSRAEKRAVRDAAALVGGKKEKGDPTPDQLVRDRFPDMPWVRRTYLLREAQAYAKASGLVDAQGRIPGAR